MAHGRTLEEKIIIGLFFIGMLVWWGYNEYKQDNSEKATVQASLISDSSNTIYSYNYNVPYNYFMKIETGLNLKTHRDLNIYSKIGRIQKSNDDFQNFITIEFSQPF